MRWKLVLFSLVLALPAWAGSWAPESLEQEGQSAVYEFVSLDDSARALDLGHSGAVKVAWTQDVTQGNGTGGVATIYDCPNSLGVNGGVIDTADCRSVATLSGAASVASYMIGGFLHVDVTGDPTGRSQIKVTLASNVLTSSILLSVGGGICSDGLGPYLETSATCSFTDGTDTRFSKVAELEPGIGSPNGVLFADSGNNIFRSDCTIDPLTGTGIACPPPAAANQVRLLCEGANVGGHCISERIGAVDGVDVLPADVPYQAQADGRFTKPRSVQEDCIHFEIEGSAALQRVPLLATDFTQATGTNPFTASCHATAGGSFAACTATLAFEACAGSGAAAGTCGAGGSRNRTTTSMVVDQTGITTMPVWNTSGSTVWDQTAGEMLYVTYTPGTNATLGDQVALCVTR